MGAAHTHEEMLDGLFHSWDRDGSGAIDFEEVLPHYMKAGNHQDLNEQQVRTAFDKFMESNGRSKSDGITPELFRKWLGKLTPHQVAVQFVRHVEGVTTTPYAINVDQAVIKASEGKSLKEILDSPISTIQGLTDVADDALAELGIKTIRDLGTWHAFILARAIVTMAEKEDALAPNATHSMNIREALDREHEAKSLKRVLGLPPSALSMLPNKADEALGKLKISTIRQFGSRKAFAWANAMVELEKYEVHGTK